MADYAGKKVTHGSGTGPYMAVEICSASVWFLPLPAPPLFILTRTTTLLPLQLLHHIHVFCISVGLQQSNPMTSGLLE